MLNEELQQPENEPHLQESTPGEPPAEELEPLAEPESESGLAAGTARLVVKRSGAETDTEFVISPPAVVGRFDPAVGPVDVDLGALPESVYVSRKHAKITSEDGVWMIHDLGSSNGTFVLHDDFERVEAAELADGQEIALGNARFVFHLS